MSVREKAVRREIIVGGALLLIGLTSSLFLKSAGTATSVTGSALLALLGSALLAHATHRLGRLGIRTATHTENPSAD